MPLFNVLFTYTETGVMTVSAPTKAEAIERVDRKLEDEGLDNHSFETKGREYGAMEAEAII